MIIGNMITEIINTEKNGQPSNESIMIKVNPSDIDYVRDVFISENMGHYVPMIVPNSTIEKGNAEIVRHTF